MVKDALNCYQTLGIYHELRHSFTDQGLYQQPALDGYRGSNWLNLEGKGGVGNHFEEMKESNQTGSCTGMKGLELEDYYRTYLGTGSNCWRKN